MVPRRVDAIVTVTGRHMRQLGRVTRRVEFRIRRPSGMRAVLLLSCISSTQSALYGHHF